jgi:hypothetical protein
MPSPEQAREHPYWQTDLAIGEATFHGEQSSLRLRLRHATEPFQQRFAGLLPLSEMHGTRQYFHARPYMLEPDFRLTVGVYPTPEPYGAIGEVTESRWEGMRHVDIGEAQAWYYPADRLIVLWECYLFDRYRQPDPMQDKALSTLWDGFEETLLSRVPEARHLVTTWEDTYARPEWQFFMQRRGYQPFTPSLFAKEIVPTK